MRNSTLRTPRSGFFWFSAVFTAALFVALSSGTAFAESRSQLIEQLKSWTSATQQRSDLQAFEKDLRLSLIHRLTFQTERKFQDGNWGQFLKLNLQSIAEVEEEPSRSFLLGLKESLENLLEPREDSIRFVQSYFEFSGVQEPASLEEFEQTRQYSNGAQVQQAHSMDLEEASEYLDEKESAAPSVDKKPLPEIPEPLDNELKDLESFENSSGVI